MEENFKRGLDQNFVDLLNEMYNEPGGWWRKFVKDEELFLAIRNNYINVYYRGNNLLKLERQGRGRNRTIVGKIHYKYLLQPRVDEPYVEVVDGKLCFQDTKGLFFESLDIKKLKATADPYAGPEKTGVYEIICANRNILDTEVGFSTPRSYVDFSALIETEQGVKIVFFEAKHFTNKELRANNKKVPKVVDQIEKYARLLQEHHKEVIKSYCQVCCNLRDLRGFAEKCTKWHKMIEDIANEQKNLCVDTNPRLVVFGYDRDQENGDVWKGHREKLEDKIGKSRVLLKGDSKGFTCGISK